ncbi:Bud-site selection protein [Chaetomium strumarium]|uniref:Bud-site selection protein n=1 Tax=Chaetomium strumarium TaxID=1170767 RepID=A0AAJ0GNJ4_9PEZI|nr:Bud-site selection protein [Chaetomium strumarium]
MEVGQRHCRADPCPLYRTRLISGQACTGVNWNSALRRNGESGTLFSSLITDEQPTSTDRTTQTLRPIPDHQVPVLWTGACDTSRKTLLPTDFFNSLNMPKRKRDEDASVDALFFRFRNDLFHSLKIAKAFERQRQAKRLKDPKSTPERKERVEKEIVVLKSLDLHQTAHAHLCSSLLKIKSVAESEKLPNDIKAGVPKPELTEEEKALLHNVTSALYNRAQVKDVVQKALGEICKALGVAVPGKRGKASEKEREGPNELDKSAKSGGKEAGSEEKGAKKNSNTENSSEDEREGHGTKRKEKCGKDKASQVEEGEEVDEEEEEKAVSQLDELLGLESEEEEDDEEEMLVKGRRKHSTSSRDLDPMEITTDEDDGDDEEDDNEDLDPMQVTSNEGGDGSGSEDDFQGFSDVNQESQGSSKSEDEGASDSESSASSIARSPPAKKVSTSKKAAKASKPTDSTFLPTLMGGYISGSESASDVDLAPPRKNRRGQRARQAIWEKRYGEKAKHLQKPANGRDAGWDLKRGAVDGDSKPWKRGIRNPLLDKKGSKADDRQQTAPPKREPPPRIRDDSGPLHPSWEAKRLAKEKERLTAPFQGKKITFD